MEASREGEASGASAAQPAELSPEEAWKLRRESLTVQNNWRGTTGLLRTSSAFSGAPGTFRLSFLTGFYSGSGFLCGGSASSGCDPYKRGTPGQDKVSHISTDLGLSATVAPFLEAFVGLHATATSNTQGRPQLLQVLGDTNWGLKAFVPRKADRIWGVAGELDLWLLNGTGGVGLNGGATSFAMRALGSLDLTNRTDPTKRIPLIAHLNMGFRLDNSGQLVNQVEDQRASRITRIERFGLNVNRVDSFELGFGFEGPFRYVRPFLEWTVDVPVQARTYVCNLSRLDPGDGCLGVDKGFSTTPSRLGIGARAYPVLDGLAVLAAFNVGTGATQKFLEEVVPEMPWSFFLGISYAADTKKKPEIEPKRVEVERVVEAPKQVQRMIVGKVIDNRSGEPVPGAILKYQGRPLTGMVSGDDGAFQTANLEPGAYAFSVTAPGYKDSECPVTVPAEAGPAPLPAQPPATPVQPGTPGSEQPPLEGSTGAPPPVVSVGADGILRVTTSCRLDALPKVGNVLGTAVDADSGAPVPGAKVKIQDKLGRQLELTADGSGSFRFENVPPGAVRLFVDAPEYLPSVTEIEVKARDDVRTRLSVNHRPKQANVVVEAKELKLKKQVHFEYDSAKISPDSMSLIQEMVDVLRNRSDIQLIEIQGHTDNTGNPAYNQRLSQERADAVRDALANLGIEASRLSARGYGQDKPLAPNVNEANKAKNRRVQILIKEQK